MQDYTKDKINTITAPANTRDNGAIIRHSIIAIYLLISVICLIQGLFLPAFLSATVSAVAWLRI